MHAGSGPPESRSAHIEDPGPRVPDWIVTFSDMISLLVTFFILLMTFSSMNVLDAFQVEGRLTGWMAYRSGLAALKVWLAATPEVRAERVAQRESKSAAQALEELRAREGSEARRYEEFHQIDISDLSIYDVLIETEKTDPNAVVALIISRLKSA